MNHSLQCLGCNSDNKWAYLPLQDEKNRSSLGLRGLSKVTKVTAGCDLGLHGFKVKLMTMFLHAAFLRGKMGTGGPGRLL